MDERAAKISITTLNNEIEKERQRLINIPYEKDFEEWLGGREYPLKWMKEQFGETLTEKTSYDIYIDIKNKDLDYTFNTTTYCQICGELFLLYEIIIEIFIGKDYDSQNFIIHKDCEYLKTEAENWIETDS